ncbi:EAL domain-containing protein [Pseudomonas putida CSV86]|uniref:cyclic-guanylate-specific phosphodiesterase n=1 Tax=Pseudomonas bharatica CSV86 TaxID=1005395 RepID=A0A7K4EER0_9PSED|nr:EAL domain-containing protein [Pseudomonas bharatica]NNJ16127.1 EAL domain-containing protein [Pseudomonas bharatica CSV86]
MSTTRNLSESFVHTLEQAIDSVVVIDSDNRVILFNGAAEKLWGFHREEVLGNNVSMLVPENIRSKHDGYVDSNRRTGVNKIVGTTRDVPIHKKDGSQRWGSMSISRVETEGQILYTAFVKDVTEQRKERKRTKLLSLVADQTDNAIFITDGSGRLVYLNKGFEKLFGYHLEEIADCQPAQLLVPDLPPQRLVGLQRDLRGGRSCQVEELLQVKGGERIWCNVAINPVAGANGELAHTVTVLTEITASKIHQVLQHCILDAMVREMPLASVMDLLCSEIRRMAPEVRAAVIQVDENGAMHPLAAPGFSERYGQLLEGMPIRDGIGSSSVAACRGEMVFARDIASDPHWTPIRGECRALGISSAWSIPIKSAKGAAIGVLAFYYGEHRTPSVLHQQIVEVVLPLCAVAMEREANRESIRQLAFYDSLTRLPNRSLLHANADHALIEARRTRTALAVLFIDLDRFKQINDSLGHPAGDELLKLVAQRLGANRNSNDIVGRLSGDEFVVVLPDCDSERVNDTIEEIRQAISQPCRIAGSCFSPSASIGVSLYPRDGHDMSSLIHRADMAMYQAKSAGRGRFSFFSHELDELAQERQALESALREAIAQGTLQLHYQPQVTIEDGRVYGVEALARWTHPTFGVVSPARFIPLAEECGLITELGHWVLREACRQLAAWRRRGLNIPAVSVNLSPSNFHNLDLAAMIGSVLDQHGLVAADLTIELTENLLLDTNPGTMKVLHELNARGIRLAMDDFGTGYSSLSYLRKLPIQELKLDRSFVLDLEADETSRALSDAVMRIGDSLHLKVVAEGVEQHGQYRILKDQGYHVVQGYLLSKPLPAHDLEAWMMKY